jgi:predicted naringenin-chalcone synthase
MPDAYINRITTAVPPHDVHEVFLRFARGLLTADPRRAHLFDRMAERAGIAHRYSFLEAARDGRTADEAGFYTPGAFPGTAARMAMFEAHAPALAAQAARQLLKGEDPASITHLLVTSCTGFAAPGLDLQLIDLCGLNPGIERSMIGFMGCYAAVPALKLARHIVRSEPNARVMTLNLELCSLHLHESGDLNEILSFLLFGDGAAAALISADPLGVEMQSFHAALVPNTADLIRWNIRDQGFDMVLSGQVPAAIHAGLAEARGDILGNHSVGEIDLWAVHPGGRTVLDAVESAFALGPEALWASRGVLSDYGNMSSATIMFVLERLMAAEARGRGCAMAFGPGLVAETMRFHLAA